MQATAIIAASYNVDIDDRDLLHRQLLVIPGYGEHLYCVSECLFDSHDGKLLFLNRNGDYSEQIETYVCQFNRFLTVLSNRLIGGYTSINYVMDMGGVRTVSVTPSRQGVACHA